MTTREKILEKIGSVPAMPTAALKVFELLQNPDADIGKVSRIIEMDPGLTSNLLRLANSAHFGCPQSVGSVKEAFVRLGTKNVLNMLIPLTVAPMVRSPVAGYGLQKGALLDHCVATAVGAEELASALRIKAPKEIFTAAILHDIGKVFLGTFIEVDFAKILRTASEEGITFEAAEGKILGIDHAEAGAALLERWNCPTPIVEVARWHHQPESGPEANVMIAIVHVADGLSIMEGIGAGHDGLNYRLSEKILEKWRLDGEAVERISCRMLGALSEMRSLFEKVPGAAR